MPSLNDLLLHTAERVVSKAREKGLTICTAESCTGGMVSMAITSIPGASDVFEGTVVSYSNRIKNQVLGVSQDILDTCGAVSEETACAMSSGVRKCLGCDAAVSITGIAGPGGAVPGKPVGTVWIGISNADGERARLFNFDGDREKVRLQSACAALDMLNEAL